MWRPLGVKLYVLAKSLFRCSPTCVFQSPLKESLVKYFARCLFAAILCGVSFSSYANGDPPPGDSPLPIDNACAGHLTRPADVIIYMQANQQEYLAESDDAPGHTWSSYTTGQYEFNACTRRIIEIRVPASTSSGCADCYPNAEIHACAGYFPGSKVFEEICRVPVSGTSEAKCKTFNHKVDVYKRPAGSTSYGDKPVKSFVYKGFMENGMCRVAAKNLGQIHDTSEVYGYLLPPASGTDRYRVLSYPVYDGNILSTEISVHFESMGR